MALTPSDKKATLTFNDCTPALDVPIYKGSIGPDEDEDFVSRKLYQNVDYYSGIVQKAIGNPGAAVHRHLRAGADRGLDRTAQRIDRRPEYKIGRPRRLYVGSSARKFVPLRQRGRGVASGFVMSSERSLLDCHVEPAERERHLGTARG